LKHLPAGTLAYDIAPEADGIEIADYREVKLPYMERSLVIGNPPFGRANKLSVQFIKASLQHSDYIAFIQPIS
jgi:predicted RNA methylase